jgi:hypothetical protein
MELYRVPHTMASHTVYYWIVMSFIGFVIIQSILIGIRFFFRNQDEPKSYFFFALLLLAFALTQLHFELRILGLFEIFPIIRFIPIYFTLILPVLFFYYIKTELFPGYQLRWTDAKHFILAIGQILYFLFSFISMYIGVLPGKSIEMNPFFGSLETGTYVVQFFVYLFFSLKYISVKKKSVRSIQKKRQVIYLELLVQIFTLLFIVHTLFILSDFYSYRFAYINMQTTKVYTGIGILTFTALLFCLCIYGIQLLIWGKKRIYTH